MKITHGATCRDENATLIGFNPEGLAVWECTCKAVFVVGPTSVTIGTHDSVVYRDREGTLYKDRPFPRQDPEGDGLKGEGTN